MELQDCCSMASDSATFLIPGLPDDVSLLCLARVPRRFHHILRCVSRRWRAVVVSEEFISHRHKYGLQETWIYALCFDSSRRNSCYVFDPDPKRRSWKPLPFLPSCCLRRDGMSFESLGRKLFLLGGCSWNHGAIDEVYCYDASCNAWEEAPPMPRPRCYFVTATIGDTLYAIDGEGVGQDFSSWDTYNLVSNSWTVQKEPKVDRFIRKAVVIDRKIYTFHSKQPGIQCSGIHDEASNMWNYTPNNGMEACCCGPTVVVDGVPFMLDEDKGMRLAKFQDGLWIPIGRLSSLVTGTQCQLAAVGRKVFVVGKGLRTVVVDVDAAVKGGRMLVTSPPIPGLDSDLFVISCKTITI